MARPRVVLRAFTCRRDVAPTALLARLLERKGCEVLITCVRDFTRVLQLWKPEAVFNTPHIAGPVKAGAPGTAAVFLDGEGFQPAFASRAVWWRDRPEYYKQTDAAYVWGPRILQELHDGLPDWDLGKLQVVGNPAMDLIRFLPESVRYDPSSRSVGFVGRFHTLNFHDGTPPLLVLPNPGTSLERAVLMARAFVAWINCIRAVLARTDFSVSIRPHPLEHYAEHADVKALVERLANADVRHGATWIPGVHITEEEIVA